MAKGALRTGQAQQLIIRVNVGGPEVTDWSGKTWRSDRDYVAGSWGCLDAPVTDILTTTEAIACVEDERIHQSMRQGERLRYRFDLPNGTYKVRLLFTEIYWCSSDAEKQAVRVQGKTVLDHFNIFDDAGANTEYDTTVTAKVTHGHLDIHCVGQSLPMHSGARISAIEITAIDIVQPKVKTKAKPSGPVGPYNVLLVSFDTLRRDHVHAYGHPKKLSPTMDALARSGVMFDDCVVDCGWTLPQHTTLLTGAYPIKHGQICLDRPRPLRKEFTTLAEVFREAGYMTFGFGNQNSYGGGQEYGFDRGMRHYTTAYPFNNMMELTPDAIGSALRAAKGTPFFLYYHTNDTHEPFAASEPFGSMWGGAYFSKYEGEVTYVDHYLGKILDELKALDVLDRTLIVVTSDHGSEFAEHGFYEKKLNLYEEIVQIPLIMSLPGALPKKARIPGLCQTSDIAPTILDICSLPIPKSADGRSLLPRIQGKRKTGWPIVFAHTMHEKWYNYEHFSARSERFKLIRCAPFNKHPDRIKGNTGERFARLLEVAQVRGGYCRELYDLKKDPGEQNNIIASSPKIARDLEKQLDAWIRQCGYRPLASGMTRRP
ncbi:MAG: sulfatase-like hydrolase/transferase [Planctomycetota bacterium]|jgi:arylsulfatase A-like enzyme